jgi:hypothetical protein
VTLEGALQLPGARKLLGPRLSVIGLLRVARERRAQARFLPKGDLPRLAGPGNGAEPPVRRRQRDE